MRIHAKKNLETPFKVLGEASQGLAILCIKDDFWEALPGLGRGFQNVSLHESPLFYPYFMILEKKLAYKDIFINKT